MCTDGTKSSHMKKCSELPGRAFTTSRLPGGVSVTKRSPHCLSILNSCHINNLLLWDVQTPYKQFLNMHREAPRRKTQCAFIQVYLPLNLAKRMFHGTCLEKRCSRYTQLWAPLWGFNRGCGAASGWQKASQLTFPAPTGPTTANSSPALTVKERPCRVGVSDAWKLKFIEMYPHYFRK